MRSIILLATIFPILFLTACSSPVPEPEARSIAVQRFCEFLDMRYPDYVCENIQPTLSEQGQGKRMYEFSVRKSPEITVVVIVHPSGRSEVSLWDDIVKTSNEEKYGQKGYQE